MITSSEVMPATTAIRLSTGEVSTAELTRAEVIALHRNAP
jgi:hypothetical protein